MVISFRSGRLVPVDRVTHARSVDRPESPPVRKGCPIVFSSRSHRASGESAVNGSRLNM